MERPAPRSATDALTVERLLAGSLQGVLLTRDGEIVLANAAATSLFQAPSPATLTGLALTRLFTASALQRLEAGCREAREGAPARLTASAVSLAGRPLRLEVAALPLPGARGRTWQLTLLDRTELEQARHELAEQEEAFRDIIDGSLQGIYVHIGHHLQFVNQAFAEIFGYASPEEVLAYGDVMQLYAPEERPRLQGYYEARIRGGTPPVRYEFQGLRADGRRIWLENMVRLVTWQGRQSVLATVIDISERKRAEQELQASEEKYRNVVEGTMQGILVQRDRRALFVNQAFVHQFGFKTAEDVYALADLSVLIADDDRDRLKALARARMQGEPAPERYVGHGRRKDGGEIWVDTIVRVVNWEDRPAIQVALVDVSERVRAERELEAQRRLLQAVFDTMPHSIYVKDLDLRYRIANRAFCKALRRAPEEIIGHRLEEVGYSQPAVRQQIRETDERLLRTGEAQELDGVRIVLPDGSIRHLHMIKVPLRGEQGEISGLLGVTQDITQRVEVQERLRASERLMRMVFDLLPYCIYVKDLQGRFQFVNTAFAAYYRMTPERIVGRTVRDLPLGDAADLSTFLDSDSAVLRSGRPLFLPEVALTPVGSQQRIQQLQKLPLHDDSGAIVGIVGLTEDITDRIRAQEELRASQRLLREVIDALPHSIYVRDREGRYRVANKAVAEYYRRPLNEVLGRTLQELCEQWTPQLQRVHEADQAVLREDRTIDLPDVQVYRGDGVACIRHVVKIPLHDERGQVTGVVGISEDVTERRRVEEELRSSRMLLQTVFDLLPLWVFVKDTQRRFLMINRKMAEDYGLGAHLPPGALIDLGSTIRDEEKSAIHELDQRVLDTGELIEVPQVALTLPRSGRRVLRTVRRPLRDAAGTVTGIIGIAEDITERLRTEDAIQQAQKLESLGVLAGGIAHDFNNLLVAILGNASLALMDLPQESPALAAIAQIETAGQRAAELCRQMLAYSGKASFEIASLNLNALIREMTQLLQVSLARTIRLVYDFAPDLPAVECDPTQIRQVVMNLVMNAAEAIGEQPGTIRLSTAAVHAERDLLRSFLQGEQLAEGEYVLLEVQDTGVGIAQEVLGRIFDPFFSTKFAGRGLGLAAVLGIVRGHKGALCVISTPGEGSLFRMLLPAQGAGALPAARASGDPRWHGQGTALVVDDQEDVREVIQRMLVSLGFEVLAAANGHEALERMQAHGPAIRLLVLDITMPGMGGEQTLRHLRERIPEVPVVLVSGHAESEVRARFAALGVTAVLQKPFTLRVLSEQLQALLGERAH